MKVFQEITQWESKTPNHIYFMSDSKSKAFAYIPEGSNKIQQFKLPLAIDIRGRKFKEIPNKWNFVTDDKPAGRTWSVVGSRGDSYTVSEENGKWACSCSGFRFRGQCKHITETQKTEK